MSKFFDSASSVFRRAEPKLEDVRTERPKPPGRRRKLGGSRMRDQRQSNAIGHQTSDESDGEKPSTSRSSKLSQSNSRPKARSLAIFKSQKEPEGKAKKFHSTKESSNADQVQKEVEGVKNAMEDVARGLIDRLPKVEQLEETAVTLETESQSWAKASTRLEDKMKAQNRKVTKILMIIIGVGVVIVVPTVIYLVVKHEGHAHDK